jgi:hypothetical protein
VQPVLFKCRAKKSPVLNDEMDKPCSVCRAEHRPAPATDEIVANQPHVGVWGNLPASHHIFTSMDASTEHRTQSSHPPSETVRFFFPRTRCTLHTRAVRPTPTRVHRRLATRPNHTRPRPGGRWVPRGPAPHGLPACLPPGPNRPRPGKESHHHPTTTPSKPPGPHLSAGAQAAASGHAAGPPCPRCRPRRGTRAYAPPFKNAPRRWRKPRRNHPI